MTQNDFIKNIPLIIMISVVSIIIILSIAIIGTFGTIKSKSKKLPFLKDSKKLFSRSYSSISAIFSLELICILAFFIILYYLWGSQKLFAVFLLYILCNFLYLINCVIIPIYFKEFKFIVESAKAMNNTDLKELLSISKKFKGIMWSCYIFLIIFFLFDFILLNLYHRLCFDSEKLCICIIYLFNDIFCSGKKKDYKKELVRKSNILNNEVNLLTEEIKKLMYDKKEIKNKINHKFIK